MHNILLAHLSIDFDYERIYNEITDFILSSLETGPEKKFLDDYNKNNLPVNITHFNIDTGKINKGTIPGYKVISLTRTSNKHSIYGFNFLRNTMHNNSWYWIKNFEYTKSIIEKLPFEKYFIVKVISLKAGGIGIPHIDSDTPKETSLTLEILSGGTSLNIYYQGKTYNINGKVYYFDDSVLHGTDMVTSDRIIIRVHGILKKDWKEYIDYNKEILYL